MTNKLETLLNRIGEDLFSKGFEKEEWNNLCKKSNNYKDYSELIFESKVLLSKSTGWTIFFSNCHLQKISRKSAAEKWNKLSYSEKNKYNSIALKVTADRLKLWRQNMKNMKKKSISELLSQFESSSEILLLTKSNLQLMISHLGYYKIIDSTTSKKLLQALIVYNLYSAEKTNFMFGTKYTSKINNLIELQKEEYTQNEIDTSNDNDHTSNKKESTTNEPLPTLNGNKDTKNEKNTPPFITNEQELSNDSFYDAIAINDNNKQLKFDNDTNFDDYGDIENEKKLTSNWNKFLKYDIQNILMKYNIEFEDKATKQDLIKKCITNKVKY